MSPVGPAYRRLLRPLLFRSPAEEVHDRTLAALARVSATPGLSAALGLLLRTRSQPVDVAGIRFRGPVGLAAGLDKDARAVRAWGALGFSHVELGTVTAQPQPGNAQPRMFRMPASGAVINRMGFNNAGALAMSERLEAAGVRRGNRAAGIPLGVSLGKTRTTPLAEAVEDYLVSLRRLAPYADYVAVNVSSPNTPGLRSLQDGRQLNDLLGALTTEARRLDERDPVPVLVKIAPDLSESALDEVLEVAERTGVAGVIATNTTLGRGGLSDADLALAGESGGLSGAPLTRRTREVVGFLARRTDLPVIAVGGIMTVADGQALLDAGARLLQVYTGFIYAGPELVRQLNRHLVVPGPTGLPPTELRPTELSAPVPSDGHARRGNTQTEGAR
ncbi:MAG: quinone-dependent dihydroorotate dehydrogenase [Propionibacteriaceae bacterium]